jgi:hypothetical protein
MVHETEHRSVIDLDALAAGDAVATLMEQLELPGGRTMQPGPVVLRLGMAPGKPCVGLVLVDQHGTTMWGPVHQCVAGMLGRLLAEVCYAGQEVVH